MERVSRLTVELEAHGEFSSRLGWIRQTDHYSKRDLGKLIADAFGGGQGLASSASYWTKTYPKAVLLIVYNGLVHPEN